MCFFLRFVNFACFFNVIKDTQNDLKAYVCISYMFVFVIEKSTEVIARKILICFSYIVSMSIGGTQNYQKLLVSFGQRNNKFIVQKPRSCEFFPYFYFHFFVFFNLLYYLYLPLNLIKHIVSSNLNVVRKSTWYFLLTLFIIQFKVNSVLQGDRIPKSSNPSTNIISIFDIKIF